MKTFKVIPRVKITYLAMGLFFLSLAVGILFFLGEVLIPTGDLFSTFLAFFSWGVLLFPLSLSLWSGFLFYVWGQTRLIFDEYSIRLVSLEHLPGFLFGGLKPFALGYDQIAAVRTMPTSGVLEIVTTSGRQHTLVPAAFGKNWGLEILIELRNRLPVECFGPEMEPAVLLKGWKKTDWPRLIAVTLYALAAILYFFIGAPFLKPWLNHAWKVEALPGIFSTVRTYSADEKNGFWLLSWQGISREKVYRYTDRVEQTWEVPSLAEGQFFRQVSGDPQGNPILWLDTRVLHYNQDKWESIAYPDGVSFEPVVLDPMLRESVVSGGQVWAITGQGEQNRLVNLEVLSGKWTEIPLPANAVREGLSPLRIGETTHGDFLVLMGKSTDSGTSLRVYLLTRANLWQVSEYPFVVNESVGARDFFLDADNALWLLLPNSADDGCRVAKITSSGESFVTQLPSPPKPEDWGYYKRLFVDSHGRLWISGSYPEFFAVFTPQWGSTAQEATRYTEANSGYQASLGPAPFLAQDGRFWTFANNLATLDTNQAQLPAPLPAWAAPVGAQLRMYQIGFFAIQLIVLVWLFRTIYTARKPKKH